MAFTDNEQRHALQLCEQLAEQLGSAGGVLSFLEAALRSERLVVQACGGRPELHDVDSLPGRADFHAMLYSPTLNGLIHAALWRKTDQSFRSGSGARWTAKARPDLLRGIAELFWEGDRRGARERDTTPRRMLLGLGRFFLRQLRSRRPAPPLPESWRAEAAALRSQYPVAVIAHALAWRYVMRSAAPLAALLTEQRDEIDDAFARARDAEKKTSRRRTRSTRAPRRRGRDRS